MDKKFQKFIGLVFLFIASLACADQLLGEFCDYLWRKMPDGGERVAKSNYVVNRQESDMVVVGSSRAETHYNVSILSDSLQMSGYNAGGDGQGLLYTLAVIRNIVMRQHPPKLLIVDINPWDYYDKGIDMTLLYPQYRIHPEIKEMIDENIRYAPVKMRSGIYRYNTLFGRMLRSILLRANDGAGNGYGPRPVRKWNSSPFESINYESKSLLSEYKITKTEETLDMCKEKNIAFVFVLSPIYSKYEDSRSNAALATLARNRHIPLLDYSHSAFFVHKQDLFHDYTHMNSDGADLFSSLLASDIKLILQQESPEASHTP